MSSFKRGKEKTCHFRIWNSLYVYCTTETSMPNILSEFSQKNSSKKKHTLFIHSIAVLQNKPLVQMIQPHRQHHWTFIRTMERLSKIYTKVLELICFYQLT